MDAVFENPGPNYLSAGEAPLPKMYFALFILYSLALWLWSWVVCRKSTNKSNHIHYLMAALMTIKCLSLLSESIRFHYIAQTGYSEGWSVVYYIFASLKGIMLFTVILLIGSGWSLVKPFLNAREKNIIVVVLSLQVLNNIAMVVLEETSPGSMGWLTWRDVLHVVDIVCCIAILYPIFWSINHFRQAAEADGKARDNLQKLQLFRQFYVMVLCYIYFTRVIVFLLTATVPFYMQWLGQLCLELGTLLFFVITGYKFQPANDNVYMKVRSEDEEDGREYGLNETNESDGLLLTSRTTQHSAVLGDEDM